MVICENIPDAVSATAAASAGANFSNASAKRIMSVEEKEESIPQAIHECSLQATT